MAAQPNNQCGAGATPDRQQTRQDRERTKTMLRDDNHIQDVLTRRILGRIDVAQVLNISGVSKIAIAGGALMDAEPHDYDIYAATSDSKLSLLAIRVNTERRGWTYVTETANALTMKDPQGRTYQFCTFCRKDPQELIEAFDFAHCQVCVSNFWAEGNSWRAYYTDNFLQAMAAQRTFFVSSPYPMGALCRVVKYAKYGYYGKEERAWVRDVFKILTEFVRRGFMDYDDFKDQVYAVDLGYSGPEVRELWKEINGVLDGRKIRTDPADRTDGPSPDGPGKKTDEDQFPF